MSSGSQTRPAHPILIPELLALTLSFLDEKNIIKTTTVCRQWAGIALDASWRTVTDFRRLLGLLGSFTVHTHYGRGNYTTHTYPTVITQKLKRPIRSSDWKRFDRYAYRVRSIAYDDRSRRMVDASVWDEITSSCPREHLLPNLQSLFWYSSSIERQVSVLHFLHPGVKHLSINLFPDEDKTMAYLSQLHARAPRVTHLEIGTESSIAEVQEEVLKLLGGFPYLSHLTVPLYCLTSIIMSRLSTLRHLSSISFSKPVERRTGHPSDVVHWAPSLVDGAFPTLQHLSMSAHLVHALDFVNSPFAPRHLTKLYVNVIAIDNPFVVRQLFTALVAQYPQLKDLYVDFIVGPDAPIVYPPPPLQSRPGIETIRPLLSFPSLTSFGFRWDYQLNLTQSDVEEIASRWPRLESLLLNCQPIPEVSGPLLTMDALIPFARHCPQIQQLGLYLDGTMIPSRKPSSLPPIRFKSLRTLSVGASTIASVDCAALFLSQLLPPGCKIESGVRWPDAFGLALDKIGVMDERRVKMTEWWVGWNDVAKVLPLATEARMEERARISMLEKEIERMKLERK